MTLRQKQDATKEKRQIEALEAPPLSEVPNAASKSASLFRPKHQAAVATVAAAASSGLDIAITTVVASVPSTSNEAHAAVATTPVLCFVAEGHAAVKLWGIGMEVRAEVRRVSLN
jgi:hypothetical protein